MAIPTTVRYVVQRLVQWVVVIFVGVTVTFIITRLGPINPVQTMVDRITSQASFIDPHTIAQMKQTLSQLYGTNGTIFEQYGRFLVRLVHGDFGPSLANFPTPVMQIIGTALPWTAGLLLFATIVSWLIGVFLGALAGYNSGTHWARVLDVVIIALYPIPYYIMAFILVMLFTYLLPIFPLAGGASIGMVPSLSLAFIGSVIQHGALPAISLILVGLGWRFMSMRALVSTIIGSDYVTYAEIARLPRGKVLFSYVMRNSMLPQVTDLALGIGTIFSGALITEVVFSYPGIGQVLYTAIIQGDYNLILGVTVISIIAIATAALIIDLLYPLFDPRIRYR